MIKRLSIRNFKSIKELDLGCARINLFIGEPNTGKSNIIESLGLFSWFCNRGKEFNEFVRFRNLRQLFYEGQINQPVEIYINFGIDIDYNQKLLIGPTGGIYIIEYQLIDLADPLNPRTKSGAEMDTNGRLRAYIGTEIEPKCNFVKFYRFKLIDSFPDTESLFLLPPYGSNLVSLIMTSEKVREIISQLSSDFGLKIMVREDENTIEFIKQITDIISFSCPYITVSDTLLRMIFYNVAVDSNENSTLVFEEPEVHAFPSYVKQLGEKIAFDKSNQYFIATHNPYLLLSILEKTPKDEVNVFITDFIDYQTKVKCLNEEGKSELMEYDPFANLDYFLRSMRLEKKE